MGWVLMTDPAPYTRYHPHYPQCIPLGPWQEEEERYDLPESSGLPSSARPRTGHTSKGCCPPDIRKFGSPNHE